MPLVENKRRMDECMSLYLQPNCSCPMAVACRPIEHTLRSADSAFLGWLIAMTIAIAVDSIATHGHRAVSKSK